MSVSHGGMISLEQARRIDPELRHLSDDELLVVIQRLYSIASIALDQWQEKERFQTSPLAIPEPTKTKV